MVPASDHSLHWTCKQDPSRPLFQGQVVQLLDSDVKHRKGTHELQ